MSRRLVCVCNLVTESEILQVLKKGARSTADIQLMTRAGTSCGRCLMEIDRIVEEYLAQKGEDAQQRLEF
ncbi:MAG: (2Fe-2S)-binding protein [Methylococcaceae bacterium]|nr:(2Fe-2S)-binding protein [Prolixibacteraceae bacterium]